ncbi:FecR family protein [Aestuariivivens sp. NBU2969]|uniref:FecR family protein n=1 Tax=Aestuariivivens sp. NBU2969 TaxID=2873267 RepID=UPI001CBF4041|nr:FecR domain-containing protein [Aestuariivivens sp. NBU2969]
MSVSKLVFLIEKHLKGSISEKELITLKKLPKNHENAKIYKNLVQDHYQLKTKEINFDAEQSFMKTNKHIVANSFKKPILFKPIFKYAMAGIVLLSLFLAIFLQNQSKTKEFIAPIIVNNNIKSGTDKAILTLGNGSNVTLEKGQAYESNNMISNGEEVVYNWINEKNIEHNYLTIPRGGQFQITLSDGTKVWLNSETQLKYPVSFSKGNDRVVELVYGEAYFDVSPSTSDGFSTFKVLNEGQEINVLGTEFNIKAYGDERIIYCTLVEGKVMISSKFSEEILKPGEQSELNLSNNTLTIKPVEVYYHTSWKDGVFSFENMKLKDIMKSLSRWYDMDVVFDDYELESLKFNGGLKKEENVENILKLLSSSFESINYDINDKTITFKKAKNN